MAIHTKKIYRKIRFRLYWNRPLSQLLAWMLLVLVLFYGMHRYFEYRNRELDKRLEQLRSFFIIQENKKTMLPPRTQNLFTLPTPAKRLLLLFILITGWAAGALKAQTTWMGTSSTNWNTPGNWSAGIPDANDDVTIPDVITNPTISTADALAKTITVESGGVLTISAAGTLVVNGGVSSAFYNLGTVNNSGTITIDAPVSFGIRNEGTFNHTGGTIRIDRSTITGIWNNTGGIFTNQATLLIGSTVSTGQYCIYNFATFNNNTGGQISIDRSTLTGLNNTSGSTFTNQATIDIGSTASVGTRGIFNGATFNNNTGGQIKIDRSTSQALYNNAVFTNQAMITIGSIATAGADGLYNNASFYNNTGGQIKIDRAAVNNTINGTFTNQATITLGATISPGAVAVNNSGIFHNNTGGQINIDRSTSNGITNFSNSTFNNQATINIGLTASAGSNGIQNNATFNNSAGQININNSTTSGIYNPSASTFNNLATINIGPVSTGNACIQTQGNFNNNGGQINMNGSPLYGLYNMLGGIFTNNAAITIGSSSGSTSNGILNNGTFNNNTNSSIHIDRTTNAGINSAGAFTNASNITIGGIASVGLYGINSTSAFSNNTGGLIKIDRCTSYGISSQSTFINNATLTIGSTHSIGTYGIRILATFNNDGQINIDRSTTAAIAVFGDLTQFFNDGTIRIGATASVGTYGIYLTIGPDFISRDGAHIYIDRATTGVYAINNSLFDNAGEMTIGALAPIPTLINMQADMSSSPLFRHLSGTLKGAGTLSTGFLCSGGTLAPGNSPGIMTIQSPPNGLFEAVLDMEVNGTGTPGVQYDQIVALGAANLTNCTLALSINYTPAVGHQMTILTATSITGTFASVTGLPANWFVNYTPTAVILTYGAVLPVEMTGFSARLLEKTVQLDWRTATENNNAGFHVERSANGFHWKAIGFIAGNGTTREAHSYTFQDKAPAEAYALGGDKKIVYYRLRQVDFDGTEQYSKVASVDISELDDASDPVQVFPNPVSSGTLHVFLSENVEASTFIRLFNPAGQLVRSITAGGSTTTLDLGDLPAGIYSIQVASGRKDFFDRVVIQK